ncbi:hypothetical protein CEXT_38511 [Caerostris extrusa]|uniref:Uncharacterized protein n=1 Tax=Caerostris extrusa TaxID=172846 RepID=A0AAV4RFD3_CAEEX|nr:hypothetical protein CEXT_38511 [Caerostris extrusa]
MKKILGYLDGWSAQLKVNKRSQPWLGSLGHGACRGACFQCSVEHPEATSNKNPPVGVDDEITACKPNEMVSRAKLQRMASHLSVLHSSSLIAETETGLEGQISLQTVTCEESIN